MDWIPETLKEKLAAPFDTSEIEWRVQLTFNNGTGGIAVPYVTNRAIQNRLDETVGIDGWKNEFSEWQKSSGTKNAQLCGLSIFFPQHGEWIAKWDGAEDSDIEPTKGGLSDAMKRAAVQWGIGRYLYAMETQMVDMEIGKDGKPKKAIAKKDFSKLDQAHDDFVAKLIGKSTPNKSGNAKTAQPPQAKSEKKPPAPQPKPAGGISASDSEVYEVIAFELETAANNTVNTHLQLRSVDGRVVSAYLQGEDSRVAVGVTLTQVKLVRREQNGVVYYTVGKYAHSPGFNAAA